MAGLTHRTLEQHSVVCTARAGQHRREVHRPAHLTITNPKQAWSPAQGKIDVQNRLTFTAGGLTHLTATFNPATRVISISNNTEWRALPSAPIANIAGKFTDPAIPGDEVTIVQVTIVQSGWGDA
eukprot:TRINITY_DN558_c0_g1_i16.p2 TRINITY_DN558_c0_g1~~TRINITY_DN558_c0_g1_i16.p2  ORF type:complete len:125 (+),score=22.56 TRINITY_DN558_c0_g1_i16:315-689(+)